jgi:DNA-binding MarR family transcriptional regulator
VVALIDNLQNRAFVSRDPVPGDRRSYALRATLAGIRQWEKAIETIRVHEQRAFARLSDSERATLVELLSRVEG